MSAPSKATLDVELRVNGEVFTGALVIEPGDFLVLNLGPRANSERAAEAQECVRHVAPELAGRVIFTGVESMAVVRGEEP